MSDLNDVAFDSVREAKGLRRVPRADRLLKTLQSMRGVDPDVYVDLYTDNGQRQLQVGYRNNKDSKAHAAPGAVTEEDSCQVWPSG